MALHKFWWYWKKIMGFKSNKHVHKDIYDLILILGLALLWFDMTNTTKAVYVHYKRVKISNKSFIWLSGVRIFKIKMIMSRKLPLYLLLSERGLQPKINHFVINVTTHIPCNLHRKPYMENYTYYNTVYSLKLFDKCHS